jgi:ABC-type bacteriocin/lantibiotic exporter with double-glycine peptidase domain
VPSILITPILRHRLNDKFKHGAANTAFLTESITGIGTVKSMAVEPQMQRKLGDHLSSYVHASFRSQNLNNVANQVAGLINKLTTLGIIWWGAHLVIANDSPSVNWWPSTCWRDLSAVRSSSRYNSGRISNRPVSPWNAWVTS